MVIKKGKIFSSLCAVVVVFSTFGLMVSAKTPSASKAVGDGFGTLSGQERLVVRDESVGFFVCDYITSTSNLRTGGTLRCTFQLQNHSGGAVLDSETRSAKSVTEVSGDYQLDHVNNFRNIIFDTYCSHEAIYTNGYVVYTSNQYKW